MADVFISYSKADRTLAEELASALKKHGLNVWWDTELYAGDDFHNMIRDEIKKSKAVVVIWSESAVRSTWVRGEAEEAADLNLLISTAAPGFDPRAVPINFRSFHCEPVKNQTRIIVAIERKISSVRAADSQYRLGLMHEQGNGVAKNEEEAARLFRLAAAQGHADAQFRLGMMHEGGIADEHGLIVEPDETEAERLYKLAADQGHAGAQFNLAGMYDWYYEHDAVDLKAVKYYKLAAEQGHAAAQYNLGKIFETGSDDTNGGDIVNKNEAEAARLFRLAAAQGHAEAQFRLGMLYDDGRGVDKNIPEAIRLFRLASEQGLVVAQYYLGRCYELGRGVPKNKQQAVRFFKQAADKVTPMSRGTAWPFKKKDGYLSREGILKALDRARTDTE